MTMKNSKKKSIIVRILRLAVVSQPYFYWDFSNHQGVGNHINKSFQTYKS